jgi:Ni/Fe-hydrogenase subunit HybB-like protein
MFLLGSEVFTEFYTDSAHVASAKYLFFGLHGYSALVPWIWTAIALNTIALLICTCRPRARARVHSTSRASLIVGIWIEKGMGLIVPAFVPSPLGEIVEYVPTLNEILSVWASGPSASWSTRSSCGSRFPSFRGTDYARHSARDRGSRCSIQP